MTYKENTPTFNVNRNVVNFKDFDRNIQSEKDELDKMKLSYSKSDVYKNQKKTKYNKVTHKLEELPKEMVDDKIEALKESKIKSFKDFK